MNKLSFSQMAAIKDFVEDMNEFCVLSGEHTGLQVRTLHAAKKFGCPELRTKKNDYLAVNWDELGNVFVLTTAGERMQLLGSEAKFG